MPTVIVEKRDHLLLIWLNRPDKRNAFNIEMLEDLGRAYERLERDEELRAGVLYAVGDNFTAGLDLVDVAPRLVGGVMEWPDDARDPWRNDGRPWTKPVVAAAQGWCLTLGIELLLAADIRIAAEDTRFAQLEVQRGIYPFGGATTRLPREAGWGNAMRWLLTGDEFGAAEALRIGLVAETVTPGAQLDRAVELAERIARGAAPLGVRATLTAAQRAIREGDSAAEDRFVGDVAALFATKDGAEGVQSFVERRAAHFVGA
ncbi:crotonase/enoyl-CoA hydratase family protein [Mycolicibacterium celeriflavum]|uniref:crotonase/enoyl-CoA hydratase family protein n=1 Tax=Mycolicibacterium celeriflavum TaxID=1249101 RepID=UPI003CE911F4